VLGVSRVGRDRPGVLKNLRLSPIAQSHRADEFPKRQFAGESSGVWDAIVSIQFSFREFCPKVSNSAETDVQQILSGVFPKKKQTLPE